MTTATGTLFVVAAPSGGGKTSLTRALLDRDRGIRLSVSYTTRPPRPGEQEGVDYHFVSTERFMALRDAGEFLEHAHVHGNWYATSASWLTATDRRRPGRPAGNRLAGRGAGASSDPVFDPHLHPAAVARIAAKSACTGAARTTRQR